MSLIHTIKMNENVVKVAEENGVALAILRDSDSESPREWDNLGTMVCMHRQYNLGDKHDLKADMFSGWDEIERYLWREKDAAVVLRLDLYDHGGITMCVGPYTGPDAHWDSGQVGFIYVSKEDIRKNWGIKRVTKKYLKMAEDVLRAEVKTYDQYLTGDVYGFAVEKDDGSLEDSCFGFYGDNLDNNGMKDHIPEEFHHLIDKLEYVW